jgi:transcription elongation GreA/GreB family factor
MTKEALLQQIIAILADDLAVLDRAARAAHHAATHEECMPDNKYDTTALEASYVAQGQANRAQEIRSALEVYRSLVLRAFGENEPIRLTALVTLEDGDGTERRFFLGPVAGGLKIADGEDEVVVITPHSPLGSALLGKMTDDQVESGTGKSLTVVAVQ